MEKVYDAPLIGGSFVAIADNHGVLFGDEVSFFQSFHNLHVIGGGGFYMHIVLEHFFQHMPKMGAFSAISIMVLSSVVIAQEGFLEVEAGLLDFFANDG
jgi:hypothetical protein